MEAQYLRGEITELMLNSSIVRVQKLADDQGIKPLINHFLKARFNVDDMVELNGAQLKELIDFVERFHATARSEAPDAN